MLADALVSQHDSTVHVQGFSHQKRDADDHDVIKWHHCHYAYIEGWEYIRGCAHKLEAIIWVFGSCTFKSLSEKLLTLCCHYFSAS